MTATPTPAAGDAELLRARAVAPMAAPVRSIVANAGRSDHHARDARIGGEGGERVVVDLGDLRALAAERASGSAARRR